MDRRRESMVSKKRSPSAGLRQKTSASIVTQKTTLPQIETIKQRDEAYEVRHRFLEFFYFFYVYSCFHRN